MSSFNTSYLLTKGNEFFAKLKILFRSKQFDSFYKQENGKETSAIYKQKKIWDTVYSFAIFAISIFFLLDLAGRTVCIRLIFSFSLIYLCLKKYVTISFGNINFLKISGIIEGLFCPVVFTFMKADKVPEILSFNFFAFISCTYLTNNTLLQSLFGVYYSSLSVYALQKGCSNYFDIGIPLFLLSSFIIFVKGVNDNLFNREILGEQEARILAENSLQNKTLFVASISHDLKNPLNAIIGSVEMLKDSPRLSENEKRMLNAASYSGKILLYLVGNILDLSKIETGKFDISNGPMRISFEIGKIAEIEQEIARQKGINMYIRYLSPIPKVVLSDPMRFAQILINLIGNSVKFTSQGFVGLIIRWIKNGQKNSSLSEMIILPEEYFIVASKIFIPSPEKAAISNQQKKLERSVLSLEESPSERQVQDSFDETPNEQQDKNDVTPFQQESLSKLHCISRSHPIMITTSDQIIPVDSMHNFEDGGIDMGQDIGQELDLEMENCLGATGTLILDIIDSGIGMTLEETQKLFQPFSQANSTVRKKYGGTGLGLWITKQLITLMQGKIEVRSEKGKGTVFRISIPMQVSRTDSKTSLNDYQKKGSPEKRRKSTRLVGDLKINGVIRFMRSSNTEKFMRILILEAAGYEDELKLKEIIKQLKDHNCEVCYSSYDRVFTTMQKEQYEFDLVLAITCSSVKAQQVYELKNSVEAKIGKPIALAILSGILYLFH